MLIDRGTCIARYGVVVDSKTFRPIRGAQISYGNRSTTGPDGWYRLDLGCPDVLPPGGGTTVMEVFHPDYNATPMKLACADAAGCGRERELACNGEAA